jgi:molybdopterin/thiamine biosynthesis adenylyltransferase
MTLDTPHGGLQDTRWSRDALWLAPQVREYLARSHLVVIGCGGNGIIFVITAAHLGVRHFTLCDADTLTVSNLNRFPIALPGQVGQHKVAIAQAYLAEHFPETVVDCVQEPFPNPRILATFPTATLVVGCVDRVHPRLEMDVLARKYRRVLLDVGTGFTVDERTRMPQAAGGRLLISRPAGPCLLCLGFGDQTGQHSYFLPHGDAPEPSSLLLNMLVGALATECLLREAAGELAPINRVTYDRGPLVITATTHGSRPWCTICGEGAAAHVATAAEGESLLEQLREEGIVCRTA